MQNYLNDKDYCTLMRRKLNIKLKTVADNLHVSISVLSRWERGEGSLKTDKVNRYVKFLEQYNRGL